MKIKRKKVIAAIAAVAVVGVAATVALELPRPVRSSNVAFDLSQIADGSYIGICDNGMIKVKTEVEVINHVIADVRLLEHDNGMGRAAEAVTGEVVRLQSVEVDAISGATMSSKTILKAVESALSDGGETK